MESPCEGGQVVRRAGYGMGAVAHIALFDVNKLPARGFPSVSKLSDDVEPTYNKPSQSVVIEATVEEYLSRQFRVHIIENQDELDGKLRQRLLLPGWLSWGLGLIYNFNFVGPIRNIFIPGYGSSARSTHLQTASVSIGNKGISSSLELRVSNGGDVEQYNKRPYSCFRRFSDYQEVIYASGTGARCLSFRFELDKSRPGGAQPCRMFRPQVLPVNPYAPGLLSKEWFDSVQVALVQESQANMITLNFRIIGSRRSGFWVMVKFFDIAEVRRVGDRQEENGFVTVTDYVIKLRELARK